MSANPGGIPFYLNRAGHEILGVAQDRDISGMKTLYLHPEWAREIFVKDGLQAAIRHGSWAGETTILARNGKEIPVSQVLIAHKSSEGQVEYFSTVLRDMTEYREAEEALRLSQQKLLETSRMAGMAEVATGVLHNVGNVLNSVNVSATLVADKIKKSKISNFSRAAGMLREHESDLGGFLTSDPKGRQLPVYLSQLAEHLTAEQSSLLQELDLLRQNIEHIKDIVMMQQNYARVSGVSETVKITDLAEDALRLNAGALARH